MSKIVLFQAIQFIISTKFSSLWSIDWTQSGVTTHGPEWTKERWQEGVLRIPQSFSIAGTSLSDYLESYPGHSLGGSYPTAEFLSVYSTALTDRVKRFKEYSFNAITPRYTQSGVSTLDGVYYHTQNTLFL